MIVGINATAAFKYPRCGVEEYCYQLIRHLTMLSEAREHRFFLYIPKQPEENFWQNLPANFVLKPLSFPIIWTQIRLSLEMFFNAPEVLFIPVHVLPMVHPQNSVVAIQGLEYEHYPEMYPKNHLRYLRWSTKYAAKRARKIITASESTKNDLIKFYRIPADKMEVIYHGFTPTLVGVPRRMTGSSSPYFLYLGRIEFKKNISGIVKAFEILKRDYKIPHKLILAGADGYGAENLKLKAKNLKHKEDVIFTGYINEREKWELLRRANMFLFPSFYEGFGFPILEAQSCGVPVVTSNISSMPEVAGEGAMFVEPHSPTAIAQAIWQVLNHNNLRDKLINQGFENLKRFSWEKCARETLEALVC